MSCRAGVFKSHTRKGRSLTVAEGRALHSVLVPLSVGEARNENNSQQVCVDA